MTTTVFQRFTIRHLAVINNLTCLSSKSTQSTLLSTATTETIVRPICSVQSIKKSSLSCKPSTKIVYNINYLNCNLQSLSQIPVQLRFYATEKNKPNQHNQYYQRRQQQQSTVNSETDITLLQPDKILMRYVDELIDFREKKPTRTWLTVIKVLITMFFGVNFGAFMAKLGATLLEKYEIFVRDEDDSDD